VNSVPGLKVAAAPVEDDAVAATAAAAAATSCFCFLELLRQEEEEEEFGSDCFFDSIMTNILKKRKKTNWPEKQQRVGDKYMLLKRLLIYAEYYKSICVNQKFERRVCT
jgi:hypothetical protein